MSNAREGSISVEELQECYDELAQIIGDIYHEEFGVETDPEFPLFPRSGQM